MKDDDRFPRCALLGSILSFSFDTAGSSRKVRQKSRSIPRSTFVQTVRNISFARQKTVANGGFDGL